MNDTTIVRSPLRRWFFAFGIVLGAALVQLTFAAPAHAGDLGFPYGGYGGGYPVGGYGCGYHCGGCGYQCGCGQYCYPPVSNVIERHYVVRSYYERRVPYCCGYGGGYGYGGYGGYGGGGYGGYGGYGGGYYHSAYTEPPYPIPYGDGYGYGGF
jgi:hypothetical protein